MRFSADLEFYGSMYLILETNVSFDFALLFREIILFFKEFISIQLSLKLSLNDCNGKFYDFYAIYSYLLHLYTVC